MNENSADKLRAEQRARNYERQAQTSGKRADWIKAAQAWLKLKNSDRFEECKLCAEMCKANK